MQLEKQVVSLELAKRLKELGVKQEGLFCYVEHKPTHEFHLWFNEVLAMGGLEPLDKRYKLVQQFSAFTVAELGDMLPARGYENEDLVSWSSFFSKDKGKWIASIFWRFSKDKTEWIESDTEADARAKMLIYLFENKLIEL